MSTASGYDNVSMSDDAKVALNWLQKLAGQLIARNTRIEKYDRYYRGDHPLLFATPKYRDAFAALFRNFADNWTELVVDAVEERLNVEGFRFPKDDVGERKAWEFWQANNLDADSQLLHTEALIAGVAYTLTWPGTDGEGPLICVEDPQQVIVAHTAGNRRQRLAAVKIWTDSGAKLTYGTVYLPGAVWKFERPAGKQAETSTAGIKYMPPENTVTFNGDQGAWRPREVAGETWPLTNPLGVVPVVPLYNKPRISTGGESEIKNVIPMQDATNKLLADMMIASEFAAFRQRWATGLELPTDPDDNDKVIEPFKAAVDRLWTSEDPNTKFGEFNASELSNYTGAIELLVQHVASQTRTPPHYFYLSGQFPSGESIKSAETGLVAKAKRKMRHFGEGWEETMRLAFLAAGDKKRASATALETIWGDPESRSEGEHVDATIKLRALGVPLPALWERAGFSPTEIARFNELRVLEKQYADPSEPLVPTPPKGTKEAPPAPQ